MSGSGFPYAQHFSDINMLADMQVPRQDRTWLLGVPRNPEPHDVVLWLGCNILRTTHLARTVTDMFRLLDVDFVAVAGMAYCCGFPQHRNVDIAASEALSDASVRRMAAFRPKTLVIWCPSCFYFYDEILAQRHSFPFALVHVTEFLAEHLKRLRPLFREHSRRRVALHAHTGTSQRDRDAHYGRVLLQAVPGLEIVDVMQEPELGRHCTNEAADRLGAQRYRELLAVTVRRAIDGRADTLATLYHTCQRELCRYERGPALLVENYITLLGRALGIEYPDKYKEYALSGDQEAILADAAPCLWQNGVDPERARGTIRRIFAGSAAAAPMPRGSI
ncbi:MAG: (Fe-S)-binding protein [Chloroflexi bacterium]|nr:(Fe-S)-binding protein [Chloroflexota bacterium]